MVDRALTMGARELGGTLRVRAPQLLVGLALDAINPMRTFAESKDSLVPCAGPPHARMNEDWLQVVRSGFFFG